VIQTGESRYGAGDLLSAEVRLVVDVRTMPRSRTTRVNRDVLPDSLAEYQIGYEHIAELGGLRAKRRGSETCLNTSLENRSFRNYADYAHSEFSAQASPLARTRQ
jgi:uncharacterized protein (DUF488 family)